MGGVKVNDGDKGKGVEKGEGSRWDNGEGLRVGIRGKGLRVGKRRKDYRWENREG
jgi:hypothetical protein